MPNVKLGGVDYVLTRVLQQPDVALYQSAEGKQVVAKHYSKLQNTIVTEEAYYQKINRFSQPVGSLVPQHYQTSPLDPIKHILLDYAGIPVGEYLREKPQEIVEVVTKMLRCVRSIHSIGYVLRKLAPHTFLINNEGIVKLINLSSAFTYKQPDGAHRRQEQYGVPLSSPTYLSISALEGKNCFRKEDLESLGYCIMELINSERVPWSNMNTADMVLIEKRKFLENQCDSCFAGIQGYLRICTAGPYDEDPPYDAIEEELQKLLFCESTFDPLFDQAYPNFVEVLTKELLETEQARVS